MRPLLASAVSLLDQRVELRALVSGLAADWLGTLLTAGLLGAAFGLSPETPDSRFEELLADPGFLVAVTLNGLFFTALGGWVAGRLARGDELRHGVIVGILSLVFAAVLAATAGDGPQAAWWVDAIGYLLTVPAAAAGGWLAGHRHGGRRAGDRES